MAPRPPAVFGRNVRAFRTLRRWSIRDLAARSGISTKTIVKIERGEGCTVRTEQKIALGFNVYVGRLWDDTLLSEEPQRVIRSQQGRWFFADIDDAARYHRRLVTSEERLRSDPDEIQDEAERHRLGYAGLSRAFVKAMGGGMSTGYFQYNQGEYFGRDYTPPDGTGYTYLCICLRGGVRFAIRDCVSELGEGDAVVFEGSDGHWIEPLEPVHLPKPPPLIQFLCLRILTLPKA